LVEDETLKNLLKKVTELQNKGETRKPYAGA
jgi:hypothetical protein